SVVLGVMASVRGSKISARIAVCTVAPMFAPALKKREYSMLLPITERDQPLLKAFVKSPRTTPLLIRTIADIACVSGSVTVSMLNGVMVAVSFTARLLAAPPMVGAVLPPPPALIVIW